MAEPELRWLWYVGARATPNVPCLHGLHGSRQPLRYIVPRRARTIVAYQLPFTASSCRDDASAIPKFLLPD